MPSFSFIKKKASDVASAASSTASTTVSTIKHGAVQAAETTGGVAAATTQQLQETTHTAYVAAGGAAATAASAAGGAAATAYETTTAAPRQALEAAKAEARLLLLNECEARIDKVIAEQRHAIGADPDMPRFVARRLRKGVDTFAPDVKYELMRVVEGVAHANKKKVSADETARGRNPCACLRAAYLYALYPYDKTFWKKVKAPAFLLITACRMLPFAGIQSFMFLLNLCLIDRRDEYQLVAYVQAFKSFQFYTTGLVSSFVGSVMYMSCAGLRTTKNRCAHAGPGGEPRISTFVLSVCGFVLQVLLAWVALRLMTTAIPKGGNPQRQYQLVGKTVSVKVEGRKKRRDADVKAYHRWKGTHGVAWRDDGSEDVLELDGPDVDHVVHQDRNHLERLCAYDVACFALVVAVVVGVMLASGSTKTWQVQQLLFWGKTWYALLAFPYQVFALPGLGLVLTHARPTGYDRQGRCVAMDPPTFGADDATTGAAAC